MHEPDSPYYLKLAELDWHGENIPIAREYNDIYFQKKQGLEETEYVFLKHNRLQQRFEALNTCPEAKKTFTIAETGFGTGLNFLATCRLWAQTAPNDCNLHYISTEKHPLKLQDLKRALKAWPQLSSYSKELIENYPVLIPGHHTIDLKELNIHLHLLLGDAIESIEQLRTSDHPDFNCLTPHKVDAWFLDGFAPAKNPSLWNDSLYQLMAQLSQSGTSVATFTAVSDVRRGLIKHGFSMKNEAGFNKRNMLSGIYSAPSPSVDISYLEASADNSNFSDSTADKEVSAVASDSLTNSKLTAPTSNNLSNSKHYKEGVKAPWYVPKTISNKISTEKHVVVIGGGLAGTSSAYALACRNWRVTLIERMEELAQGASGNSQGMLYTKLSAKPGLLNNFTLSSYLYALRFYQKMLEQKKLNTSDISFCGMLQLANNEKQKRIYHELKPLFSHQPELIQFLDADKASEISGVDIDHPAWLFPGSGWLSPKNLCHALVNHPNISVLKNTDALSLNHDKKWNIFAVNSKQQKYKNSSKTLDNSTSIASADVVIIANSHDANQFKQCENLPFKTIRGQVTQLESSQQLSKIKTVICHDGYITPAINGTHNIGATFSPGNMSTKLFGEDHLQNINNLQTTIPSLKVTEQDFDIDTLPGRAGLRCMAPDYLPIVGPVHNQAAFMHDFSALRKNSHQRIDTPGEYYKGLYINIAHGSRGLTSTPLCSEILASQINQHTPPANRDLIKALNPARFDIRNLIKNK